jgi:hypothetical protein
MDKQMLIEQAFILAAKGIVDPRTHNRMKMRAWMIAINQKYDTEIIDMIINLKPDDVDAIIKRLYPVSRLDGDQ